jgi:hypothetical protein
MVAALVRDGKHKFDTSPVAFCHEFGRTRLLGRRDGVPLVIGDLSV